jgi:hypothetical protein
MWRFVFLAADTSRAVTVDDVGKFVGWLIVVGGVFLLLAIAVWLFSIYARGFTR